METVRFHTPALPATGCVISRKVMGLSVPPLP